MKLEFYPVDLPCEFAFTISRGTQTIARHVFVTLTHTENGVSYVGRGEAAPNSFYGDTQENVLDFLTWVQKENLLANLTPFDIQVFNDTFRRFPGHMPAKSALEMALYDLYGQILGHPLYKLFGLDVSQIPKSSYTIGIASLEEIRHKTQVAMERGYDILKIKVGSPDDWAVLKTVRSMVPQTTVIRVDANAAWQPDEAIALFPKLVDLGVEFVEEPLQIDTPLPERHRVKESAPLPILADESVHTLTDIPMVSEWADGVNLKLTKTGGITEALKMIHAARAHNLSIMLGCFVESSLSVTALAHLSPLVDYLDLDGALLLADDPMNGITWKANQLSLPTRPGLGVIPKKTGVPVVK